MNKSFKNCSPLKKLFLKKVGGYVHFRLVIIITQFVLVPLIETIINKALDLDVVELPPAVHKYQKESRMIYVNLDSKRALNTNPKKSHIQKC